GAGARRRADAHRPPDRSRRALVPRGGARLRRAAAPGAQVRQLRQPRFLPQVVRPSLMTESQLRDEMCRVGRSLFERGYVHATAGNISVRLDDGFLITPTDACLGFLDPAALAKVDLEGRQVGGAPASKTLALHRRIYGAHATLGLAVPRCVI